MLVDTHAHPEQDDFNTDRDEVIKNSFESGLLAIIAVGTSIENSQKAIDLAKHYENIYPTVGIHPSDGLEETTQNYQNRFESLIRNNKIVAIGECGLDIYKDGDRKTTELQLLKQIELFEFQIDMAKKYNLPLIIHCRNGWDKIFEVIDQREHTTGVFHCWTGDLQSAKKAIDRGFYIAFGGILTFKNAGEIARVAKEIDINKIVLETDSPFLAPEGLRGSRNEPKNVRIVAQFIAELRGVELKEIEDRTTINAYKLFGLN